MNPTVQSALYRLKLSRNALSQVAHDLGLSVSHVCAVAKGKRQSARVETAIANEFARIDREVLRFERKIAKKAA